MRRPANHPRPSQPVLEVLEDRIALNSPADLDPTFGTAGRISNTFTFGTQTVQVSNAVGLANGGLVLAGGPALVRVQANGVLDPTFGTNGLAQVNFNLPGEQDTLLGLVASGNKFVAGYRVEDANNHVYLAAARV